ncbi:MAG: hypothetical protein OEU54_10560 [Gemmatimonadota bacterium]|nr:hypothetical protein [Gemmatimonadota bacterium]
MSRAGRAVVAAVRLDRWTEDDVRRGVDEAMSAGVGGFVLFGGDADRVSRLTGEAAIAAGRDLWFAADLERGAGQQFRGLTELPPPAALAKHPLPREAAAAAGTLTAAEARSVGVNWVLAPVTDIDAEPDNPIVATRSFSSDPAVVGELGLEWISACQAAGALACAKHFPGHGRTLGDSHVELPVVDATSAELEQDIAPFHAVTRTVGSVMVAHVAFPALGSGRAATVSPEIVGALLRGRLGFDGLVATDAMIMSGIGDDDAAAAVEAIRAGCDVILYPGDVIRTVTALDRTASDDPLFADRLAESIERSDRALSGLPPTGAPRDPEAAEIGLDLALRTVVDRSDGMSGWRRDRPTEVVAVSDDPEVGPPAGREGPLGTIVERDLRAAGWSVRPAADTIRPSSEPAAEQRVVVLAATPRGWKGHGRVSDEATARLRKEMSSAERSLLVMLGHDRWLAGLGVPGICAWSTESVMEHAAAAWIDGRVGPGFGRK